MTAATASYSTSDLPPIVSDDTTKRHILTAESELRIGSASNMSTASGSIVVTLQRGSCELLGVELALHKAYEFDSSPSSPTTLAFFTWHGCVLDTSTSSNSFDDTGLFLYKVEAEDTSCNVAFVNTHAQLEAMRDTALQQQAQGPRVLVMGDVDSGKTSLCRILLAYATKLGRTPLFVDLDPADNAISIPGTLCVAPVLEMKPTATVSESNSVTPLVLWHGTTSLADDDSSNNNKSNTSSGGGDSRKLWEAQVTALGQKIDQRWTKASSGADFDAEQASGVIVNTNGWIQKEGFDMLLHAVNALSITVVLVLGHDRLYSLLQSHFSSAAQPESLLKIIKVPRSGGAVSRDSTTRRQLKSRAMKRYFYGQSATTKLTPFLAHVPISKVTIYKYSSLALSASLLPVSAKQETEPVQLVQVDVTDNKLQHAVLAICHPHAVQAYRESGMAHDLYTSGVAGFVVVERVLLDSDMLHLLSPCAGSLPSDVLILGDNVTWME